MPFINKTLSRKKMNITKLRNKFLKDKMDENKLFVSVKLLMRMMMMTMMMNCFSSTIDRRKVFTPYFQPGSLSEILASRFWLNVRRTWVQVLLNKLLNSDNHYVIAPQKEKRIHSVTPRPICVLLNRYGRPRIEPKFFRTRFVKRP